MRRHNKTADVECNAVMQHRGFCHSVRFQRDGTECRRRVGQWIKIDNGTEKARQHCSWYVRS